MMILLLILIVILLIIIGLLLRHNKLARRCSLELGDAIDDLKLLQHAGKEISSKLEMNELLPGVMNAFAKAGKVKKGSLMLYDKEKNILEIKASMGLSERAIKNVKLKIGEGIAGRVAQTKTPLLINDITYDKHYKEIFNEYHQKRPKETILSLPLIFKNEVLGVVTLDSKISGEQFIRNDERLLSILASQTAVSINNARMYEMAITDGMTKLYIHRYLLHRLKQEFDKAKRYRRPLSLIFADIDNFKLFNDTHGHQVGDKALLHISKLIKKCTRVTDICARYGGDEFVIILPETPKSQGMILSKRLKETVEESFFKEKGQQYKITISIGLAEYTSNINSDKDLLENADQNLLKAKKEGRNKIIG